MHQGRDPGHARREGDAKWELGRPVNRRRATATIASPRGWTISRSTPGPGRTSTVLFTPAHRGRYDVADPPAEYDSTPGCYAVAFDDPDRIRLEVVHEPAANP